jgi:hypothetical protein
MGNTSEKTYNFYSLNLSIESRKIIHHKKIKKKPMSARTVKELATIVNVTIDDMLQHVKNKTNNAANSDTKLSDEEQNRLLLDITSQLFEKQTPEGLLETKSKLELLYQYEKHYLELIKEYKEEIKFATALQEDLRRERSQFFTHTLREVAQTLHSQEIDKKVSALWIEELVASYTKSLDLSSDLAKTHVIQVLGIFREEAKKEVSTAELDKISNKSTTHGFL